jgi:hypothetical protein
MQLVQMLQSLALHLFCAKECQRAWHFAKALLGQSTSVCSILDEGQREQYTI